jgi:GNAT superfamily N-acetyltransferase
MIEPAATRSTAECVAFLSEHAAEPWPAGVAEDLVARAAHGFVATREGALVGALFAFATQSTAEGETLVYPTVVVAAHARRHGIGRRLVQALREAPHARRAWAIVQCRPADVEAERFARAVGFEPRDESVEYESALAAPPSPPDPRFRFVEYRGGEDAWDAAIVALHATAYRGRFVASLTAKDLRYALGTPGRTYLVVLDGDSVAAFASTLVDGTKLWVGNLVVGRAWWASGISDTFQDRIAALATARGCVTLGAVADARNWASRRLMERRGWRETARVRRLVMPLRE